jgi:hypothetical protein
MECQSYTVLLFDCIYADKISLEAGLRIETYTDDLTKSVVDRGEIGSSDAGEIGMSEGGEGSRARGEDSSLFSSQVFVVMTMGVSTS